MFTALREGFAPGMHFLRRNTHALWLGSFRRIEPVSDHWGFDRGTPVDRLYIEGFLNEQRADIRGHVLEVQNRIYTRTFGGSGLVQSDVLDIDGSNPLATVIADLAAADDVPGNQFDCFICTQTLQFIFDVKSAIHHAHRLLRPGGILLATVPTVSRIVDGDGVAEDYWRFTSASCSRLFGDEFGSRNITIRTYGNMMAAAAFLAGRACEELPRHKLEKHDQRFPILIAIRAVKAS